MVLPLKPPFVHTIRVTRTDDPLAPIRVAFIHANVETDAFNLNAREAVELADEITRAATAENPGPCTATLPRPVACVLRAGHVGMHCYRLDRSEYGCDEDR